MFGIEFAAPFLDTDIAAAILAVLSISFISSLLLIPAIKYPVNVSPAAVVSTALTLYTDCFTLSLAS